jgi:hypothetical protein
MINRNKIFSIPLAIFGLMLALLACNNATLPQIGLTPAPVPTTIVEPTSIVKPGNQSGLSQTEADVPRISVEEAKVAFDSGKAIIVDVRGADIYVAGHVAGAISIPLSEIETNPAGLGLDKGQWIITYCT